MTVTEPLVAFLKARLDEDEAELVSPDTPMFAARDMREIEAHRVILNEWQNLRDPDHWPEHPAIASARHAVQAIAVIYSDHPDYRSEWKP